MQKALPVIAGVAIVSGFLLKIFGYHIPMIGVIRPTLSDTLIQMVGTAVLYLISLVVLGWIAAYLAGMLGGRNEMNSAVTMLFWVSIPLRKEAKEPEGSKNPMVVTGRSISG